MLLTMGFSFITRKPGTCTVALSPPAILLQRFCFLSPIREGKPSHVHERLQGLLDRKQCEDYDRVHPSILQPAILTKDPHASRRRPTIQPRTPHSDRRGSRSRRLPTRRLTSALP